MSAETKELFLKTLIQQHEASLSQLSDTLFRKKAFDHFLEIGLPTKKDPSYTYFPLATLYDTAHACVERCVISKEKILEKVPPECLNSTLVLRNGKLDLSLSSISDLPKSVVICSLEENSPYRLFVHAKLIQQQKQETDPFVLLCHAQLKGLLLIIPEGLNLNCPLQIVFVKDGEDLLTTFNAYIHIGKGSKVECLFTTLSEDVRPIASYVDIDLEENSSCELTRISSESKAISLETMRLHLKNSLAKVIDLQRPAAPAKFHLHVRHEKSLAKSQFYATGFIDTKNQYHLSTNFEHLVEQTSSFQHVKTVLQKNAKASFTGQIHVHKQAVLTESYQKHATLMLGEQGTVNSRPNLRIFADDVKASHGATVAELDKDALFYLKTRGLAEEGARKLLLEAFCQEMIQHISSIALKETAYELMQ